MQSPRNRAVAQSLRGVGIGTLLVDLLTDAENERDQYTREFRFDIPRLARRVADCVDALKNCPTTKHLPVMLVGSSTGAAAALMAAAERADRVAAVVSRGGRADLAGDEALGQVRAPTLLIVGGDDHQVLQLNRDAAAQMKAAQSVKLTVVPGASHLFESRGRWTRSRRSRRNFSTSTPEPPQRGKRRPARERRKSHSGRRAGRRRARRR